MWTAIFWIAVTGAVIMLLRAKNAKFRAWFDDTSDKLGTKADEAREKIKQSGSGRSED